MTTLSYKQDHAWKVEASMQQRSSMQHRRWCPSVLAFSTLVGSGYLSACAPLEGEAADDWSTGSQDEGGVGELQDKVGVTTLYEAESRSAAQGCSQSTSQAGFTGTGFMDFGGDGTWMEWNNIRASLAGDYQLSFRYANGSGGDRRVAILMNGNSAASASLAPSGGWASWRNEVVKVHLRQGANTVRVQADTSKGGPNLDHVAVTALDLCPSDSAKVEPGRCGCGVPEGSCGGGCTTVNEGSNATLSCPAGATINAIQFASYGTPGGSCHAGLQTGSCHANSSMDKVRAACVGKQSCTVAASNAVFSDPCLRASKQLAIQYTCSTVAKLPETISVKVEHKGQTYQVELRRHSVRAPGFEFFTFDDRRTETLQAQTNIPEPRTYRGHIANDKTLVATGFIDAEGQLGLSIWGGQGRTLTLDDIPLNGNYGTNASGYAKYDNVELRDSSITVPEISSNRLYVPGPGPTFHSYLSRVRAHYYSRTFQQPIAEGGAGGNLAIGLMDIEGTLNDFDYAFGRYLGLRHDLAWVQIDLHGNEDKGWSIDWPGYNQQGRVPTNHSFNFRAWGGMAAAGGSKATGYPSSGRADGMWWHEMGHLLTLSHYNPVETHREIMRDQQQVDLMQSQLAVKELQTNSKWFTAKPFDPRTSPMLPAPYVDYITVYKGQSGTVRPLQNDYDANGETLSLAAFDATTQHGGTVKLESNGTLRYTPNPNFVGTDYFAYTAQDTAGYSAKQTVHVMVHPKGLAGYWPIDNDTNAVTDRSGYGHDLYVAQGNLSDSLIAGSQGHSLKTVASASSELAVDPLENQTLPHDFDPGHLSFSASIWFRYSPTAQQAVPYVIVGKGSIPNYDNRMGGWEIVAKGHDLLMNVAYRDRFAAQNMLQLQWPAAIKDGQWHRAVLVIDREAGLLRGYLDGQAHPTPAAIPTGVPISAGYSHLNRAKGAPMTVGYHTQDPSGSGAWDCLKVYHVALSPSQVSAETCPVKTN